MQIKIKNKEIELKFGVKFVRALDAHAGVDANGLSFGMGLVKAIPSLQTADPATLSDVIYCATSTVQMGRPSVDDIDDYIDNYDGDLEKLFDEVYAEIQKATALKTALKNMQA